MSTPRPALYSYVKLLFPGHCDPQPAIADKLEEGISHRVTTIERDPSIEPVSFHSSSFGLLSLTVKKVAPPAGTKIQFKLAETLKKGVVKDEFDNGEFSLELDDETQILSGGMRR